MYFFSLDYLYSPMRCATTSSRKVQQWSYVLKSRQLGLQQANINSHGGPITQSLARLVQLAARVSRGMEQGQVDHGVFVEVLGIK
jgi:hypothetical protein